MSGDGKCVKYLREWVKEIRGEKGGRKVEGIRRQESVERRNRVGEQEKSELFPLALLSWAQNGVN